jgi:hypothetical protein
MKYTLFQTIDSTWVIGKVIDETDYDIIIKNPLKVDYAEFDKYSKSTYGFSKYSNLITNESVLFTKTNIICITKPPSDLILSYKYFI